MAEWKDKLLKSLANFVRSDAPSVAGKGTGRVDKGELALVVQGTRREMEERVRKERKGLYSAARRKRKRK